MNPSMKFKIGLTSALCLCFAGISYVVLKKRNQKKLKPKNSSIAPYTLDIKVITSEEDSEDVVYELRRFTYWIEAGVTLRKSMISKKRLKLFYYNPPKSRQKESQVPKQNNTTWLSCLAGMLGSKIIHLQQITYAVEQFGELSSKLSPISRRGLFLGVSRLQADSVKVNADISRRSAQYHAMGFDCEWVTEDGRQPVALLQLSTYDGYSVLFRLCHMKSIPKCLKDILEDKTIFKVGVVPSDDADYLAKDYSVYSKATLDLRHLAELCKCEAGGLASLSKALLGIVLDKNLKVRCSNWEAEELSEQQITYAALDAHIAIKIFVKLIDDYHKNPMTTEHWDNILQFCSKYSDMSYFKKQKLKEKVEKCKERKPSKRYPSRATRPKPYYSECVLKAPDGELLCNCDYGKANWYIERELADILYENPRTVRLRFEPAGRSVGGVGFYYNLTKENKCAVCGAKRLYIRKNVVPKNYWKYFPEVMKNNSHDLLLCANCHQRSDSHEWLERERLAARCGAPLAARFAEDAACKKLRAAARLLLHRHRFPLRKERLIELETCVLQHYLQHDEITIELLKKAANIHVNFLNDDTHGYKVVEYYEQGEGLLRLQREWQEHFLASMKPRHLSAPWRDEVQCKVP